MLRLVMATLYSIVLKNENGDAICMNPDVSFCVLSFEAIH